jgi:hypothetical protein
VGAGTDSSVWSSTPTMLEKGLCYHFIGEITRTLNDCLYLVNQPGNFEWIPSSNGVHELGAVKYSGSPVGRVKHTNGLMRIGWISSHHQYICYAYGDTVFYSKEYDALVFKPHRLRPSKSVSSDRISDGSN